MRRCTSASLSGILAGEGGCQVDRCPWELTIPAPFPASSRTTEVWQSVARPAAPGSPAPQRGPAQGTRKDPEAPSPWSPGSPGSTKLEARRERRKNWVWGSASLEAPKDEFRKTLNS